MDTNFPFDPIQRSKDIESLVMQGNARRYYRFRFAKFYGGIATADAVACNLLCCYCWNYSKNLNPANQGEFYNPTEVADKLKTISLKHRCNQFRVSGAEPFLGEASTKHLAAIMESMPSDSSFIIESNGLILGYDPALIDHLDGLDNILIRIAIKGDNPRTWERITGAKGEYQPYQLEAIKNLRAKGITVSVAYMTGFVDPDKLGLDYDEDFDVEGLSYYQGTRSRMIERGLETRRKPSQPLIPIMPESRPVVDCWDDKGDIT